MKLNLKTCVQFSSAGLRMEPFILSGATGGDRFQLHHESTVTPD